MVEAIALIDAACEAGERGDAATALARLVDAWRLVPDRGLAEAIEAIGPVAAHGRAIAAGTTRVERDAAWFAALVTDDAALRGRVLASLAEGALRPRLAALAPHPDPRAASLVVALLLDPTNARREARWKPLVNALVVCRDPRVAARVDDIAAAWEPASARAGTPRPRGERHRRLAARVATAYSTAIRELDALAALRPRLVELVTRLVDADDVRADAAREAALRDAVFANPTDDGPRAVYADWLLERGDPLGELIALQLRPEQDRARAAELVRAHAARILGPVAAVLERWTIERGFLAVCAIRDRAAPPPARTWATVREIQNAIPATDAFPMPALRIARTIRSAALTHLATLASPPPLVDLTVLGLDGAVRATLARLQLPELRELCVFDYSGVVMSSESWWRHFALHNLDVPTEIHHVAGFRAVLTDTLRSVTLRVRDWRITLTRDELDAWGYRCDGIVADLAYAIEQWPALSRIRIQASRYVWTLGARDAMARALARHPSAVVDITGYPQPPR